MGQQKYKIFQEDAIDVSPRGEKYPSLSPTTQKNENNNEIRRVDNAYLSVRVVGQVDCLPAACRSKPEIHAGAIEIHPVQKWVCPHRK